MNLNNARLSRASGGSPVATGVSRWIDDSGDPECRKARHVYENLTTDFRSVVPMALDVIEIPFHRLTPMAKGPAAATAAGNGLSSPFVRWRVPAKHKYLWHISVLSLHY